MKMVPSNLSMEVYLDSMMLLQLLEATMGMGYCRICCQPTPSCLCAGAYESVPTQAWSQMMASIPAPGVAASSAGSTTSEASTVEVQEPGVTSPPPGLTPQDFSNWSLPLPGAPQTGGLPLPSGGGVDRQAEGPWALGLQAPTPQSQMLSAPQGMLPVCQQRLCQPAAPYQQPAPPTSQPVAPYQLPMPPTSQLVAPYQPPVPPTSQPVAPHQQALLQPSQPSTPYQQAMQPPRPAGRGLLAPPSHRAAAPSA